MSMALKVIGIALISAALGTVLVGWMFAQEKSQSPPHEEQEWKDMMAQWKEMNALGPEHEHFKNMAGKWDVSTKMWVAPGMEPIESKGSAEFNLVLDGRYLEQRFECPMMGEPFKGRGYEGFDKLKKKYISVWMDSMSTGIFHAEGTVDESGKVFTYIGKADDPFTGEKDKEMKSVARLISDDKMIYEMYESRPDVGEYKSMEITYSRKK